MKKIVLAAVAAAIAVPAAAAPGDTATTQGTATAEIVAPISISHDSAALDFGVLVSPTVVSTVTVSSGTATVSTGDAVLLSGGGSDSFSVSGDPDRAFDIVTGSGTMGAMTFTTSAATSGLLDGTGAAQFSVDGVLTIPANQAAGLYSGSYDATVTYQ